MTDETHSNSECSIQSLKEKHTATSSKDPTRVSHNMNDLILELNSADEVRQAMKASIYGKIPQQDQCNQMRIDLHSAITSPVTVLEKPGTSRSSEFQDYSREMGCSRCRNRGRPPKAGPSTRKQLKSSIRSKYHSIYSGKLCNLVAFKNTARSYCDDSDVESLYNVYHR